MYVLIHEIINMLDSAGLLEGLTFKHISGDIGFDQTILTNWGCPSPDETIFKLTVTDDSNRRIFPVGVHYGEHGGYKLPGYTTMSNVLALMDPTPKWIGKIYLDVWHGEDLYDKSEEDNPLNSKSSFNVYAWITAIGE